MENKNLIKHGFETIAEAFSKSKSINKQPAVITIQTSTQLRGRRSYFATGNTEMHNGRIQTVYFGRDDFKVYADDI